MNEVVNGRCICFGDSVDTDVIIPGRYLVSIDPVELAQHAFEPLGKEVQTQLKASEVVVAGKNFGCGSAREQAATCLIGAGIKAVVAKSFSRVFFRNSINTGLRAVECPEAAAIIKDGDEISINFSLGEIKVNDQVYKFEPYPASLQKIIDDGGLIKSLEKNAISNS
ncbi:LeuD/DmdB family oxidoreductase small subunit [Bacillus sp. Marseille-P3661]|uniref:LeuD/DmdB family oxidoreductase small subunit n=1 Tax=Bacillus sp. Marseille-P3661 TaxID=1936234 RepID=UPI000C8395B7|nr:3-isopropylmalate dehydratase [Bacillus sp. Marseille-P3661]